MWEKPDSTEPDDYVVSVDGVDLVPIMEPYMDVYEPGAKLSVYARHSGEKSEPASANFGAAETPLIEVWSVNDPDPDHPCGFGFDSSGSAKAYTSLETDLYDYWIYADPDRILLVSPSDHAPEPFNEHYYYSTAASESYSNLEVINISNSLTFSTQSKIYVDSLYSLWLSEDMSGYSAQDHFGKALVIGIENSSEVYKISFKLAYQLIPGLRWVVLGTW